MSAPPLAAVGSPVVAAVAAAAPPPSTAASSAPGTPIDPNKRRKIVSCLDCHSRKVKCSKDRPVCAQCIKRGKQATCTYEIPEDELDDEYYASLPAPPKPRAPKQPKVQALPPPPVIPPPPPAPKPIPVPRREDDLLERDDLQHQLHLEPISALGYCRTITNLEDLTPEPASVQAQLAAVNGNPELNAPFKLPGIDIILPTAAVPGSVPPQDWGCQLPSRLEVDELVHLYLTHVQEAYPLFAPTSLRQLVIELVDGSAELRRSRQVAMAQLLLVFANGARFHKTIEGAPFVLAARQKLADKAQVINSGTVRAQVLLVVYLHSGHQVNPAWIVLGEATQSAEMQGFHLAPTGQPVLWNCIVRLTFLQSLLTGSPTSALKALPLLTLPDTPFAEPLPPPLKASSASLASYSFTKILIDALALARTTDHDQFWYLESRLRSWAPMLGKLEIEGASKKPTLAVHGTRGKSSVLAAGEENSSVKYRLYYCMMTRFVLLVLRAPFASTRVSSGGGVYETRYGKWDEAWRDSMELVEAATALHEHFEEFARGNGWISIATFSVTLLHTIFALRYPWSPSTEPAKINLMHLAVMFHDAPKEDAIAAEGYKLVKRLSSKYGHSDKRPWEDEQVEVDQPAAPLASSSAVLPPTSTSSIRTPPVATLPPSTAQVSPTKSASGRPHKRQRLHKVGAHEPLPPPDHWTFTADPHTSLRDVEALTSHHTGPGSAEWVDGRWVKWMASLPTWRGLQEERTAEEEEESSDDEDYEMDAEGEVEMDAEGEMDPAAASAAVVGPAPVAAQHQHVHQPHYFPFSTPAPVTGVVPAKAAAPPPAIPSSAPHGNENGDIVVPVGLSPVQALPPPTNDYAYAAQQQQQQQQQQTAPQGYYQQHEQQQQGIPVPQQQHEQQQAAPAQDGHGIPGI